MLYIGIGALCFAFGWLIAHQVGHFGRSDHQR